MISIYGYTLERLETILVEKGYKKFNARQIYEWLYKKKVKSFDEMTNLSLNLREFLSNNFEISLLEATNVKVSHDGTTKLLFKLHDNYMIEAVLMLQPYGNSICISSQVGCNMGCKFCASGLLKKSRNLEVSELVLEVLSMENITKKDITHIVIMGTGEPFDNYDNIIDFLNIINSPYGMEIGIRHITISTSGIVPKIKEFGDLELGVNLAISLHASNDELRNKIMPINKRYPIKELLDAANYYFDKTKRRITFEYILLENVNDLKENAIELASLVKNINCYINLIPYNAVDEFDFKGSSEDRVMAFYDILKKKGVNVTVRKKHGDDIDAACGQLRLNVFKDS